MQKTTYANGDFIEYTYDNCDNVIKLVGENGVIAEFVYNKKGRVSKAIDTLNNQTTYYYYDFYGNITGEYRQSESGALSYFKSYDNDGNQVEKTSVNGQVKTITTGTDSDGNAYVSNDGITVDSTADDFGRTTEVKTSRGEGNSVFFTDYEYANVGTTKATTNLVSKLTQKYGNNEIVNYEYFYDGNGNISRIKQNGTEIARYSYDELNQLSWSADRNTGLYTQINYDNAGNITSVKEYNLSTTSWSPNGLISEKTYVYGDSDWKDKLTSYNGTTIDYDANGNPLNYRDGMIFDWITGRSLSKITKGNAELEMKYDCNGMRTQKKVGNDITNYYYDSGNNLIGLTDDSNTLLFYYDSNGVPTSFAHNGTMYYYVKNLQGDIVQITKQDGTVVAKYVYDVWGKILSIKDGSNNTIESTNTTHLANLNPFRYRGYVYDNETGLYYLQSRYYDPITGRFLNADVYADTGNSVISTNMFAYCENNAVMKYDVTGKDAWWIQSPNSVDLKIYKAGHTSLLIQEKPGFWWYFYWGDESIQLLFLGTTTQKDINKKVRNIINRYNKEYGFSVKYQENYTKSIRFTGDFLGSLQYIKRYMNAYSRAYNSKIFKMRVNPETKAISKSLSNSTHKYYKNELRPESMLIRGNKMYNWKNWNCMQISSTALSYGKVKNVNKQYFQSNMLGMGTYISPKEAYRAVISFNFGTEVCS